MSREKINIKLKCMLGDMKMLALFLIHNFIHLLLLVVISLLIVMILVFFFWKDAPCDVLLLVSQRGWSALYELKDIIVKCFLFSIISIIVMRRILPKAYPIRDVKYLVGQLKSSDRRAPATTIEDLTMRIAGSGARKEVVEEVEKCIERNTNPIEDFLVGDDKTLVIDGEWGSGKTSSTIIAVSNFYKKHKEDETEYRFVYESAFKYVSGFSEFRRDILHVVQSILSEQNMIAPYIFSELARNISPSAFGLPFNNSGKEITTSEFIDKLNKRYDSLLSRAMRCGHLFVITIILDDIDRLQGEEILQTLAFLSVLRRLKFVKIILPVDKCAIVEHLKAIKIHKPENYIKKYLPEQSEVKIESSFDLFKNIFTKKILHDIDSQLSEDQIRPILEVMCIKIFSDKLRANMEAVNLTTLGNWHIYGNDLPEELMKNGEYNSQYILSAKNYIYKNNGGQLGYHTGVNDEFEALIYKLKYKDKREPLENGNNPLRVDEELYINCIKNWIYQFSANNWQRVGATMRIVDDIYAEFIKDIESNYISHELTPHKIFVRTYNRILPKWPITDENLEK